MTKESAMQRLSIEPLSVMGLPPVEFVGLAADLGLRYVAMTLSAMPNPYGYPPFSLRDDLALRSQADAGVGPHQRLGRCVDATRELLAQLGDQ
jgi:hypothetical protein